MFAKCVSDRNSLPVYVLDFPPRRRGCSASGNYLLLNIPIMNRRHEGFDQVFEVMTCETSCTPIDITTSNRVPTFL